jgi:hypothetical protein
MVNDLGLQPGRSIGSARGDQVAIDRTQQSHLADRLPLGDLC